jgi:arylsulfatase A-like enzyme
MRRPETSQFPSAPPVCRAKGEAVEPRHPNDPTRWPRVTRDAPAHAPPAPEAGGARRSTRPPAVDAPPPVGDAALGALVAFVTLGVVDGVVAYSRMPPASRSVGLLASCAVHGAGVMAALGLVVAAAQELLCQAAARRPALRSVGAWLAAGPSRWWAHDPRGALVVASVLVGAVPAGAALGAIVSHVTGTFQWRAHMVAPTLLAFPAALAVAAVAAAVASWPLERLLRRVGRLASVGAVASVAAAAALLVAARLLPRHRETLAALDLSPVALGLCLAAVDAVAVTLLLRRRGRRPARGRRLALAAAVACAALAAVPALGLGRRQAVMMVLASRSALVRRAIGPLQRALDRDGDGHGVLFGGGDCDDRDPHIYPGATEVPANGVDESCSGHDRPRRAAPPRAAPAPVRGPLAGRAPSVLFVSIDAARPDRMGAYGYGRATTPNLDRFAAGAARFTRAYAVAPGSVRSFASTFTGRYPAEVAWGCGSDPRFPSIAEGNHTLAEALRAAGYAAAAFTNTSYFSTTSGFFQGFEPVVQTPEFKGDGAPIVRAAAEWIEAPRERPFFAWVHLIDAHAPYGDGPGSRGFGDSESDRYDAALARADALAARLIEAADRLERRGAPVLVAVFSDHGEGFNEHGSRYHFYDVHEETIRVPLLVRGPGVAPGDRRALTALLDLHATVLQLARQPAPATTASRSLVPVLLDPGGATAGVREEVYSDAAESGGGAPTSMALVAPPWKIAFDASRGAWELYNLALDPREERNVYDDDPVRVAELRWRLFDAAARR